MYHQLRTRLSGRDRNVLTITTDNGSEFCEHKKIAGELYTAVYFADRLIRQYIPKGTDFRELTDQVIYSVQLKLNRRHREN